jgi:hypothetical protein
VMYAARWRDGKGEFGGQAVCVKAVRPYEVDPTTNLRVRLSLLHLRMNTYAATGVESGPSQRIRTIVTCFPSKCPPIVRCLHF